VNPEKMKLNFILNEFASGLLYLNGKKNITQTTDEYGDEALYSISFEPFNKL